MAISQSQLEKEILTDKRKYFENCKIHYAEYVHLAQNLFYDIYAEIKQMDLEGNPWTKYNSIAAESRNDEKAEIKILKEAVDNCVYTPGTYDRLAILYSKRKKYQKAYDVCKKWFELEFWKLPNTSGGSLRILNRMEKLKKRL